MRGNVQQMAQVIVLQCPCPWTSCMATPATLWTCQSMPLGASPHEAAHVNWMLEPASHGLAISQILLARGVSNTTMLSATFFVTSWSFIYYQWQCQLHLGISGSLECTRHPHYTSYMRLHSSKKQMPQPLQQQHHPLDHSQHACVLLNILPLQLLPTSLNFSSFPPQHTKGLGYTADSSWSSRDTL